MWKMLLHLHVNQNPMMMISSPEQNLLKLSYWDQSMSVVCRQQFALYDDSYTTWPIFIELHRNVQKLSLNDPLQKENSIKNMSASGHGLLWQKKL